MRQRQSERLANNLRGRRCTQKLAAAARRCAGAASYFCRVFERDLLLRKSGADGLHLARVLAVFRQQRHSSRHQHGGKRSGRSQRHHHCGQPLVAGRYAEHAFTRRQGSHQTSQHHRRIVAKRQGVHHARGALGAAIAGIGASPCKRNPMQRLQLTRGLGNQKAHFPMSGVKPERDRPTVLRAQTAMCAENQKLRIEQPRRIPTHSRILAQAEEISRRLFQQHFRRQRERTRWACCMRREVAQLRSVRLQH